jgi:dihydropyrimidine dehydrogenase (NAD+) subunit PreA
MVAEIARNHQLRSMPISGIGGVTNWRDAAEFMALGSANIQVCTAAMVYGFRIIEDLVGGMQTWMSEQGYTRLEDFIGRAVPNISDWSNLNLNFVTKAKINADSCIGCGRCHIACEDTSHQAIGHISGSSKYMVRTEDCVGCNLCVAICPVPDCISMEPMKSGIDPRTGTPIAATSMNWTQHPKNAINLSAAVMGEHAGEDNVIAD